MIVLIIFLRSSWSFLRDVTHDLLLLTTFWTTRTVPCNGQNPSHQNHCLECLKISNIDITQNLVESRPRTLTCVVTSEYLQNSYNFQHILVVLTAAQCNKAASCVFRHMLALPAILSPFLKISFIVVSHR